MEEMSDDEIMSIAKTLLLDSFCETCKYRKDGKCVWNRFDFEYEDLPIENSCSAYEDVEVE